MNLKNGRRFDSPNNSFQRAQFDYQFGSGIFFRFINGHGHDPFWNDIDFV